MYGSYESSQYVEAITGDNSTEVGFILTLNCVTPGTPAQLYGPAENCYPAEGAEFELDSIHLIDEEGNHILITAAMFSAFVGQDIETKMFESACLEAEESGGF